MGKWSNVKVPHLACKVCEYGARFHCKCNVPHVACNVWLIGNATCGSLEMQCTARCFRLVSDMKDKLLCLQRETAHYGLIRRK